jgi:hypothetical protein
MGSIPGIGVCRPAQADDHGDPEVGTPLSQQEALEDDVARNRAPWSNLRNGLTVLCGGVNPLTGG